MEASQVLLAQALSLSALVGAAGMYAGMVRRRGERRLTLRATAAASISAVDRVERSMALARLDRTFIKSVAKRQDRGDSTPRWL